MSETNLETAQGYAEILRGEVGDENRLYYATIITAYSTLAIAEKMYEESDVADRMEAIYQEWKRDPSIARPYEEFRAELVKEGLLK